MITLLKVCIVADINECVGSHGCSHGCTNTNGSFQCTCPDGLFLSDDRRNCNGTAFNVFLIFMYRVIIVIKPQVVQ